MFEKDLTHVSNDSDRSNLIRFRTSCHKLLIEYGRYTTPKTPIGGRICKQCVMNAVEDESHFYWSVRSMLIIELRSLSFKQQYKFCISSNMSKLHWLMSDEDESICKDIASFVTVCFSLRNKIIFAFTALLTAITYLPFSHM